MKKKFFLFFSALLIVSCGENIDDLAEKTAKEYTFKHCPTPFIDGVRTDSVVFDRVTRDYAYYYSFSEDLGPDIDSVLLANQDVIAKGFDESSYGSASTKKFIDAGITVTHVVHSTKDAKKELFRHTISPQ